MVPLIWVARSDYSICDRAQTIRARTIAMPYSSIYPPILPRIIRFTIHSASDCCVHSPIRPFVHCTLLFPYHFLSASNRSRFLSIHSHPPFCHGHVHGTGSERQILFIYINYNRPPAAAPFPPSRSPARREHFRVALTRYQDVQLARFTQ